MSAGRIARVGCAAVLAGAVGCGEDSLVGVRAPALRAIQDWHGPTLRAPIAPLDGSGDVVDAHPERVGFAWGVEATIRYHYDDSESGLDAPSYPYVIDEELARRVDPVGTMYTFDLGWWEHREGDFPIFEASDDADVAVLLRGAPMRCEAALCDELLAVRAGFELDVELTGEAGVPLRAVALRPR